MTEQTYVEQGRAENPDKSGKRPTKVWLFPSEGKLYEDRVNKRAHPEPCENGHFDCALWESGPCANEAIAAYCSWKGIDISEV